MQRQTSSVQQPRNSLPIRKTMYANSTYDNNLINTKTNKKVNYAHEDFNSYRKVQQSLQQASRSHNRWQQLSQDQQGEQQSQFLPYTLDPLILEDQLIDTLSRSPQTRAYVVQRVMQIITGVMTSRITKQQDKKIHQLQQNLRQCQKQKQLLHQSLQHLQEQHKSLKQSHKNESQSLKNYSNLIPQLQSQINLLNEKCNLLQNQVTEIHVLNGTLRQDIVYHQEQYDKSNFIILKLSQDKEQVQIDLANAQKETQRLRDQLEKLKSLCKQSKYNQIISKKQNVNNNIQLTNLQKQLNKCQQQLRLDKVHRDNQRKALQSKLNSLYNKTKKQQKIKVSLKNICKQLGQTKSEVLGLRSFSLKGLQLLQTSSTQGMHSLMDHIGTQMHKQLTQLMTQLTKQATQIRILKQQVKIKSEIIQKLEKIGQVQLMGNKELHRELRAKKLQAQGLKKEMKRNYEQTQGKLINMEKGYREMLGALEH